MSRLFRQAYTKPVPAGAAIVTLKGKRCARFTDESGKAVTAPLTKRGDRIRLRSAKWYGEYTDADGITRRVPLSADKTAAGQMLAELVRRAELGKAGVVDPYAAYRKRPLAEHLDDFAAALRAKGDTAKHVDLCLSRLQAALDGTGAALLADLDAGAAGDWLTALRTDREPARLPEGQELFKLAEVAALLGVKPAAARSGASPGRPCKSWRSGPPAARPRRRSTTMPGRCARSVAGSRARSAGRRTPLTPCPS
jgi:hypothetical protein